MGQPAQELSISDGLVVRRSLRFRLAVLALATVKTAVTVTSVGLLKCWS